MKYLSPNAQDLPDIDGNGFPLNFQYEESNVTAPSVPDQIFNAPYSASSPIGLSFEWKGCEDDGGLGVTNCEGDGMGADANVPTVADNICEAPLIEVNCGANGYAWCTNQTLEACEQRLPDDPEGVDAISTGGSAWFSFVAPPSGAVFIDTDPNGGTQVHHLDIPYLFI